MKPADCECPFHRLQHHERDCVETHGFDCGPYERWTEHWWTCMDCGEEWDESDLKAREKELVSA